MQEPWLVDGHTPNRGKIGQAKLRTISVVLVETLQYLLSQILQMRLPVILSIVVYRRTSLPHKMVNIVFSTTYSTVKYNFWNVSCVLFLICTTMF